MCELLPPSVSVSLILTVPILGLFSMWILESDLECKLKQKVILLTVILMKGNYIYINQIYFYIKINAIMR